MILRFTALVQALVTLPLEPHQVTSIFNEIIALSRREPLLRGLSSQPAWSAEAEHLLRSLIERLRRDPDPGSPAAAAKRLQRTGTDESATV